MATTSPLNKTDFLGLETGTWLFTGAESPPHHGVIDAVQRYMEGRALGPGGRENNAAVESECRAQLAALLNGSPEQIGLLSNASEAISAIVLALRLQPGENVVLSTLEYPSGVLACLTQACEGVEVRVVEHADFDISVDALVERVDEKTRLVVASHVSYLSGARLDYRRLYQELQKTNALLLLDATQALGVVPVDVNHADFVVSSTYKWLLAMHGGGVLAVNPARTADLQPLTLGWRSVTDIFRPDRFESFEPHHDARRFEVGYPSFATLYALQFSSHLLLKTKVENIEAHVLELGGQLIRGLQELGLEVLTPSNPSHRAGNIAWACAQGEALAAALREEGILLWGGDGRARASIHGFNDAGDVEALLAALPKYRELF